MASSPSVLDPPSLAPEAELDMASRRSSRRTKAPKRLLDDDDSSEFKAAGSAPAPGSGNRRNPKREVAKTTPQSSVPLDELLQEALRPLSLQDIEQWGGWGELESEPAFFDMILRDLGVRDVTVREVFDIDSALLETLPKPVHGLIFLFQVTSENDEAEQEDSPENIWFANQTTANACATVALLNIVMNAQDLALGPELQNFKETTMDLANPLRGHALSRNKFIRTIHNTLTRRMDHLNADLFLENEVSTATPKSKRRDSKSARRRKSKQDADYAYHFVAYVPVGGSVWELDGLKSRPQKIGNVEAADWMGVAQPHIQARMLETEQFQLTFNLLALCGSPLKSQSRKIASSLALLRHLYSAMESQPPFAAITSAEPSGINFTDRSWLSEFQLEVADIDKCDVPEAFQARVSSSTDFSVENAFQEHSKLVSETKALIGEYRAELLAAADGEQRVQARKMDYGPALHQWVKKLAGKGILEDLINRST